MKQFTKKKILKALSELSINLASGWIGVLLISPGLFNVSLAEYPKLLFFYLLPGIVSLTVGIILMQNE